MHLSRRTFFTGAAGLLAAGLRGNPALARPGCQANAWNLDPARFDLLLTAVREMKELGFQGFETNIRFVQPSSTAFARPAPNWMPSDSNSSAGTRICPIMKSWASRKQPMR